MGRLMAKMKNNVKTDLEAVVGYVEALEERVEALEGAKPVNLQTIDPQMLYIAGPYSDEDDDVVVQNVNKALDAGARIAAKGHYPFVPHDGRFMALGSGQSEAFWVDRGLRYLVNCDGLVAIGDSPGTRLEIEEAMEHGLPVYDGVDEVPNAHG